MIVEPKPEDLDRLVAPYLRIQPEGLGFAIGYAGPTFSHIFYAGNVRNQFGKKLKCGKATPFEIASITKTFTATLYADVIGNAGVTRRLEYYITKKWLPISKAFAEIELQRLVNYTSGLPEDYTESGAKAAAPRLWPRPYSFPNMLSFLKTRPPKVSSPEYGYSNVAFAIMSMVIASEKLKGYPTLGAFQDEMNDHIFKPLSLSMKFFDEAALDKLPVGFHYEQWPSRAYAEVDPGHPFFPAYFGGAGIIATPNDMLQWLKFNMGLTDNKRLNSLLRVLQCPSTDIRAKGDRIGLGWFINEDSEPWVRSVSKDGELAGFNSYIAFLPSDDPGEKPSQAGAFVLLNADGIKIKKNEKEEGELVAAVLANAVLRIMVGKKPDTDGVPIG
jgi:D-alanyl-D-alanine-carboxypeptidase/D-alanyl-D-alanine-endopeptidase